MIFYDHHFAFAPSSQPFGEGLICHFVADSYNSQLIDALTQANKDITTYCAGLGTVF